MGAGPELAQNHELGVGDRRQQRGRDMLDLDESVFEELRDDFGRDAGRRRKSAKNAAGGDEDLRLVGEIECDKRLRGASLILGSFYPLESGRDFRDEQIVKRLAFGGTLLLAAALLLVVSDQFAGVEGKRRL